MLDVSVDPVAAAIGLLALLLALRDQQIDRMEAEEKKATYRSSNLPTCANAGGGAGGSLRHR
jgi:hypothetical protein